MASHQLAIAKASLSAVLLCPNPTSMNRDEIAAFHSAFDKTLSHCSFANIQTCKSWLLDYVVSSSNRVGVWAKYLVALSGSLNASDGGARPGTSVKRKRIHILYILNDIFHHTKYHLDSSAAFLTLTGSCQPYIVEVLGYAAAYNREEHPKHHRRLDELLDIWAKHGYYSADYVHKLREVVKNAAVSGPVKTSIGVEGNNTDAANNQKISSKDVPFVMPSTHGDPSTPFYDLPAGNMVPHIIPNSTVPLRPDSIKPLQFLAGPADEKLVDALKMFMKDVDQIYESGKPEPKDNDEVVDMDELGQPVIRDAATGEVLSGETYYGWSRGFCEQMKKRNNQTGRRSRSRSWSRSSSLSRSPSRSPSRRRYSDSPGRRSYSRSRSASPQRRRQPSRSRERSYSPPDPGAGPGRTFQQPYQQQYPSAAPPPPGPPPISQTPFPPHMYPGMIPPPPPPPPNYQGTWPPPGMPMPPGMMMMNPMNMPFPSAGPPPPPGAFPSPLPLQGGHFPPVHGHGPGPGPGPGPGAQQLPPGSFRFPPPHSGGRGRGR